MWKNDFRLLGMEGCTIRIGCFANCPLYIFVAFFPIPTRESMEEFSELQLVVPATAFLHRRASTVVAKQGANNRAYANAFLLTDVQQEIYSIMSE